MASITGLGKIGLPRLSENMDPDDARALRNYLYQMQEQSADFGIIPQTLHILREQVGRKLQNLARTRFAVPSQAHPVAQMEMRQPAA